MRAVTCVSCWLALATPAFAETYHVDAAGDDDNAGSAGAPWRTLQHAADRVVAGDAVVVHAGSYAGFDLRRSGVLFRGEPGAAITAANLRTPDGINVEGEQGAPLTDVLIVGFTVNDRARAGIRVIWCNRCTIRDNTTDSNFKWGILTGFSTDLLIEDNRCSHSDDEHGIYVSNSGDRPVVRRNVLFGNQRNGLHMNGDLDTPCDAPGGAECDGIISGALVEGNVIYGNGALGGSGINGDGVRDAIIRNNLIYESHASGISLYRIDGGGASTGNLVVNNTVIVAADGRWALNIQDAATGNRAFNNILLSRQADRGSIDISGDSVSGFQSDHNVVEDRFSLNETFVSFAQWKAMTGQDGASLIATEAALFVGGDDYHLRAGSPAIGEALAAQATAADLEGTPRDSMPDVGAYEAAGGTPAADAGPGAPDARIVDAGVAGFDAARPAPDGATGGTADARVVDARVVDGGGGGGGDAGKPVASGDASGCSCATGGGPSSGPSSGAAALLLCVLALRRRRLR